MCTLYYSSGSERLTVSLSAVSALALLGPLAPDGVCVVASAVGACTERSTTAVQRLIGFGFAGVSSIPSRSLVQEARTVAMASVAKIFLSMVLILLGLMSWFDVSDPLPFPQRKGQGVFNSVPDAGCAGYGELPLSVPPCRQLRRGARPPPHGPPSSVVRQWPGRAPRKA